MAWVNSRLSKMKFEAREEKRGKKGERKNRQEGSRWTSMDDWMGENGSLSGEGNGWPGEGNDWSGEGNDWSDEGNGWPGEGNGWPGEEYNQSGGWDYEEKLNALKKEFMAKSEGIECSLEEFFNEMTKKEILKVAGTHHIAAVSNLKKKDLIQRVIEKMVSEPYMSRYFSCASDTEIGLFERIVSGAYYREASEEDIAGVLDHLEAGCYVIEDALETYIVPTEVKTAYKKINTPDFQKKRKRTALICECLQAANHLYAITPDTVILEMLHQNGEMEITLEELQEEYWKLEGINHISNYFAGEFIDSELSDSETDDAVRSIQEDIPYYIPSRDEIDRIVEDDGFCFNESVEELIIFLTNEMEMDEEEAFLLLYAIQRLFNIGQSPQDLAESIEEEILPDMTKQQENRLSKLLLAVWQNTRMILYRGHTPAEMKKIAAGRPVFEGENKQNKIYPNDPCPCGSGKKYKKCCGKQQ